MRARRADAGATDTLSPVDYRAAFEIDRPAGDSRSAEQWARAVWEGAPGGVQGFLRIAWAAGLGFRLGPRSSPDHVLGWRIAESTPGRVVLEARSRLMTSHNVVDIDDVVRWTTLVRFEKPLARALWTPAAPVHHRTIPALLARAAAEPRDTKHRRITRFQRRILNPVMRRLPLQTLLETTGRKSGLPRLTPIGGKRTGQEYWFVSEFGEKSHYVRNIQAQPRIRLRLHGHWHTGTAHLLPADDPEARLRTLPRFNSAGVRTAGTNLLTIRVDLAP